MKFCIIISGGNGDMNAAKSTMRLWAKSLKKNWITVTQYGCGNLSYKNGPYKPYTVLMCKAFMPMYAIYKRKMRYFMKETFWVDYGGLKCLII